MSGQESRPMGKVDLEDPENWTTPVKVVVEEKESAFRRFVSAAGQPGLIWLLVILAIPASRLVNENFPSWALVNNVITLGLFLAVVAFGQGLVILTGGIDLSVPAAVALGAFFTGFFGTLGLPTILAVLIGVLIASLVGLVNGLIISRTTFPPFIVTLATASIAAALLLGASKGMPGQDSPPELTAIFVRSNTLLGLPLTVYVFILVVIIGYVVQSKTRFGRALFAIGNSPVAARIAGLKVKTNVVLTYWFASISYGIAGVLLLGYGSGSDLNIGNAWLLPSIAAIVVGGASISGGTGNYLGTVGAALFLTVLSIDISAAGISEGLKQILYGSVILIALLLIRVGGSRRA
jgi:ribose transport system permease protein